MPEFERCPGSGKVGRRIRSGMIRTDTGFRLCPVCHAPVKVADWDGRVVGHRRKPLELVAQEIGQRIREQEASR